MTPDSAAGDAIVLLPPSAPLVLPPHGAVLHHLVGQSMGSTWRLVVAAPPLWAAAAVQARVQDRLDDLVRQMSHWEADSALSRFNRLPAGAWQTLPPDFARVMQLALEIAQRSGGAFDPAMGDDVERWGFGPRGRYDQTGFAPPVPGDHAAGLAAWRQLQFDGDRLRQPGQCALDLSAIAKGYAVDAVCETLRTAGCHNFLFELGGELRGEGLKPDAQPWWVALERPPGTAHLPPLRAGLVGHALATSGDYRQGFRDAEGRWQSHTLDPRSGRPVQHALASVSVLHERCAEADALATALFVLGPDEGSAWADAHGVAAWFVAREAAGEGHWREWPSQAMEGWLEA